MGQRLSAKSTIDITRDVLDSSASLINGAAKMDFNPSPPTGVNCQEDAFLTAKSTSPKKFGMVSGIPLRTAVRKANSTSSTATSASISSPERSFAASPTKSRSVVSVHNNNGQVINDDLNGNSGSSSPNKSRIPVLRSASCKVPKNFSFGQTRRAFEMKHWYQTASKSEKTDSLEDALFEQDLKMALE